MSEAILKFQHYIVKSVTNPFNFTDLDRESGNTDDVQIKPETSPEKSTASEKADLGSKGGLLGELQKVPPSEGKQV